MTATPPAVNVNALTVRRGRQLALDALTCQITRGRVTGLLGPSGSGKSTLLRSMVGVQNIESGSVTVLGEAAGSPRNRRRVGYQTQMPSVYLDITVRENLLYFAKLVGSASEVADQVLAETGLTQAADQLTGAVSGGQLARANLACALIGTPELLVLDEPTVGQDPVLREELWQGIRRRAADGATVVVSSHVMDEAARCDELLLLRGGRLLATGTPEDITALAGTDNLDSAFLSLARRQQVSP